MTINIKIMNIFKISVLHPDLDHSDHSQRCLFDWLFTVAPNLSLAIDSITSPAMPHADQHALSSPAPLAPLQGVPHMDFDTLTEWGSSYSQSVQ